MDMSEFGIKPATIIKKLLNEHRSSKNQKVTVKEIFQKLCHRLLPLRDVAKEIFTQMLIDKQKLQKKKSS